MGSGQAIAMEETNVSETKSRISEAEKQERPQFQMAVAAKP